MDKITNQALGFIPTVITLWLLSWLLGELIKPNTNILFILTLLPLYLTIGILIIKKGYKDIGKGVISGLIAFYLSIALVCYALSGPM